MSFKLSPDVDKNKIFLVNFSELEGRLDPIMLLYKKKKSHNLNIVQKQLSNLIKHSPHYGANKTYRKNLFK